MAERPDPTKTAIEFATLTLGYLGDAVSDLARIAANNDSTTNLAGISQRVVSTLESALTNAKAVARHLEQAKKEKGL